jgi:hypothetical protein
MKVWRAQHVAWRRIDRETVVVHLTRHWMYALNESGGKFWETLAEPLEGDQLDQFLSDPAVSAFLGELAAEGLVESDCPLPQITAHEPAENDPEHPRIEWREEVRRFAGQCIFLPAQSPLCDGSPSGS